MVHNVGVNVIATWRIIGGNDEHDFDLEKYES